MSTSSFPKNPESENPSILDHGIDFLQTANKLLVGYKGSPDFEGGSMNIHTLPPDPNDRVYISFLEFLRDELQSLPINGEVGQPILMRTDAQSVLADLASFLTTQDEHLTAGDAWDKSLVKKYDYLVDHSSSGLGNEVFKNIVNAPTEPTTAYSVDLSSAPSTDSSNHAHLLTGVMVNRYLVRPGNSDKPTVEYGGAIRLHARLGILEVDLGTGSLPDERVYDATSSSH